AIVLFFQCRAKKYIPGLYWLTVVLISIFGTLVTDIMTDSLGIPLEYSTIGFTLALIATFGIWYASEKTLSMHSIVTSKREAFYWLAILFTFALGTASGDLMAESLGLGYLVTGLIVVAVVVTVATAWKLGLDAVLGFWIIYIMTRPLGASLGDYLTQPARYGGLGLGATVTTAIFLGAILLTVVFLSITKVDLNAKGSTAPQKATARRVPALLQTMIVVLVLAVAGATGYSSRHTQLAALADTSSLSAESDTTALTVAAVDYASFLQIEEDALNLVNAGNVSDAASKADDLEYTWDNAEATLRTKDSAKWDKVDQTVDRVLRQLRAVNPDAASCASALEASITAMQG
ncbi:MAG: hypothetical protein LLF96_08370, partial [Eubacteriales bacterium]|nr:hypothetical protein [Eubacteriales bacterium]